MAVAQRMEELLPDTGSPGTTAAAQRRRSE